ncbi:MAG: type I secretion system permease/ATPase [Paracoccaceae bacterium]|nr:type I secretion system permease/ATPase [Paracoccaceae bacterium]
MREALTACRQSFVAVGVFSFFINILMLTPMFYMINVYDKAVGTGSLPTLMSLVLIALFLYLILGLLEWTRSKVLVYIGSRLDQFIAPRVYGLCFESAMGASASQGIGSGPLSDLNSLRQFMASPNSAVIFDLPWIPLFLLLMYFFHPALAVVAVLSIVILAVVAIANQRATTSGLREANKLASQIASQTQRNLRNAEVAGAMGMVPPLMSRWRIQQDTMLSTQFKASSTATGFSAATKTLTTVTQSAAITTGAYLAIVQEISPGLIIGAALLLGKTLQPIGQTVTSWKSFVDAREQYDRLNVLLAAHPPATKRMSLPPVSGRITAHKAVVTPPGADTATLGEISFTLEPGTTTMVLGPSGAGKSTLVRAILGLWATSAGDIRIDGAESSSFDRIELGPQIGYLPQDIELFDGTVAENISRFGELDADLVIQASQDAGVHDLILALPEGYDTVIAGQKGILSHGQRQRVALARALYGRPQILVLDEPNSNLDEAGEQALNQAVAKMKSLKTSIIMVSHRQAVLAAADYIMILNNGVITEQGPRDLVIAKFKKVQEQRKASLEKAPEPVAQESADA